MIPTDQELKRDCTEMESHIFARFPVICRKLGPQKDVVKLSALED